MKTLPFYKVCKLLEELEGLICRFPPLLPKILKEKVSDAWIRWFKQLIPALIDPATGAQKLLDLDDEKRLYGSYTLLA